MFTKFDKNLANYLATNKIYIIQQNNASCGYNDNDNDNNSNSNSNSNDNSCGQQMDESNDSSSSSQLSGSPKAMAAAMEMATDDNNNMAAAEVGTGTGSGSELAKANGQLNNSEVDSVINSLREMNEIEGFDGHLSSHEKDQDQDQEQFQAASCSQKQQLELGAALANSTKYHLYTPHGAKPHQSHTHHYHHQPSSPVSSMSSSSASVSPILSEIGVGVGGSSHMYKQHMHNTYKEWTGSSSSSSGGGGQDLGLGMSSSLPNKKIFNRNIHCVKEKIRRDRIKFSCNELRRLIPNLNGVKTDMASLLETTVLWIQLINSNIPEQLLINNKLESLKLLRNNKNYLSANGHKAGANLADPAAANKLSGAGQKPRNKSASTGSGGAEQPASQRELHLKQEISYNSLNSNQPLNIGALGMTSLNSSLNSSFMSSIDTSPPPASLSGSAPSNAGKQALQHQHQHQQQPLTPLEHNFMSKPSKWLSLAQQQQHKYSEQLYHAAAVAAASHRSAQPVAAAYPQDPELVSSASSASGFLANASNVLSGNYSDCDFFKIAAKKSDFGINGSHSHSNNLYLGQVAFGDQLNESLCSSHNQLPASVSVSLDPAENAGMSCLSNVYFQASQQQQQQSGSSLASSSNNCFY